MRRVLYLPLLLALLVAFGAVDAFGQSGVPREIGFQGKLTDQTGNPITTSVQITFSFYNAATGGTALFSESQSVTPNARGIYSVRIGSATGGGINLPFDQPYYLGVTVGTDPEMTPRYPVVSAAYAMRADESNALANLTTPTAELNQLNGLSASVTAANLGTLTAGAGSNADSLHEHTTAGVTDLATGSAAGDVLYWNGSAWVVLAPGAAGDIMQMGGANAPTWATVLGEANGGTGQSTYTAGDLLYASAANTLGKLGVGTNGDILTMVSGAPAWAAPASTVPNGSASGDILYWNGSSWTTLGVGNNGQVLTVVSNNPAWSAIGGHNHAGASWTNNSATTPTLSLTNSSTTAGARGLDVNGLTGGYFDSQGTTLTTQRAIETGSAHTGIYLNNAATYGVYYATSPNTGMYLRGTAHGIYMATSPTTGMYLRGGTYGIYMGASPTTALRLQHGTCGIYLASAGTYGMYMASSPTTGVWLRGSSWGIYMPAAAGTGAYFRASSYGLRTYMTLGSINIYAYRSGGSGGHSTYYGYQYMSTGGTAYGARLYTYRYGSSNTSSMYGIYNYMSGYSGTTYGIYHRTYGTKTATAMVYGIYSYTSISAANTSYGFYNRHNNINTSATKLSYALWSDNDDTAGTRYGIWSEGPTYAGYFSGNLHCTGTLSKVGGSFVQPHPSDPTKEINYRFFEGPENAVFERGVATLQNGRAEITMPDHFRLVAKETGISVQLTPRSANSKGLALVEVSRDRIVVQELAGGNGNYSFDYFVTANRAGYAAHEPIQSNRHFRPDHYDSIQDFEQTWNEVDGVDAKAARDLLIRNGILNPDGTLNRAKVLELGWRLPKDKEPAPTDVATEGEEEQH
jgi:hypothetical protein